MILMKEKSTQMQKKPATRIPTGKVHMPATVAGLTRQAGLIPVMKFLQRICFFLLWVSPFSQAESIGPTQDQWATAVFAGGCFWCMEPPFDALPGVVKTVSGYTGGNTKNPSYQEVSTGGSGHVESIQITYDLRAVSYEKLLDVFWRNIDPTDDTGQFCDRGRQYRPVIFFQGEDQKQLAEKSKVFWQQNKPFEGDIKTEIIAATDFYPAEDHHQDYYQKNPLRYKYYRFNCGRDKRLKQLWGGAAQGIDGSHQRNR